VTRARASISVRGFTLLETMLALALIASLLGAMLLFLDHVLDARSRGLSVSARERMISWCFDELERDLLAVVATGFSGKSTQLTLQTRRLGSPGSADRLQLRRDLADRSYRFESASGLVTVEQGVGGGVHTAIPAGASVHRVRFRFHDGKSWVDRFDAGLAGALPRAVEIAVWYEPWEDAARAEEPGEIGTDDAEWADAKTATPVDEEDVPPPDRIRVFAVAWEAPRGEEELP